MVRKKILNDTEAFIQEGEEVCCSIIIVIVVAFAILGIYAWAFSINLVVGFGLLLVSGYIVDYFFGLGLFDSFTSHLFRARDDIDWKKNFQNKCITLENDLRGLADGGANVTRLRYDFEQAQRTHNEDAIIRIEEKIVKKKSNQQKINDLTRDIDELQTKASKADLTDLFESDLRDSRTAVRSARVTLNINDILSLTEKIKRLEKRYETIELRHLKEKIQKWKEEGYDIDDVIKDIDDGVY